MEKVLTVENVSVEKAVNYEGAKEALDKIWEMVEANPVSMKLLEAAQTVEDMYEIAKEYVAIKFSDFKVLFDKTVDYFKEPKTALSDEVMDSVVGGGFFDWWNENKHGILRVTILVGCVVAGAAIGAATGGVAGAVVFGLVGLGVGLAGATAYEALAMDKTIEVS